MSDLLRLHYLQAMPKLEQVWCFQLSITRCREPCLWSGLAVQILYQVEPFLGSNKL